MLIFQKNPFATDLELLEFNLPGESLFLSRSQRALCIQCGSDCSVCSQVSEVVTDKLSLPDTMARIKGLETVLGCVSVLPIAGALQNFQASTHPFSVFQMKLFILRSLWIQCTASLAHPVVRSSTTVVHKQGIDTDGVEAQEGSTTTWLFHGHTGPPISTPRSPIASTNL